MFFLRKKDIVNDLLIKSAESGFLSLVEVAINEGADAHQTSGDILKKVISNGHRPLFDYLLENNVKVTDVCFDSYGLFASPSEGAPHDYEAQSGDDIYFIKKLLKQVKPKPYRIYSSSEIHRTFWIKIFLHERQDILDLLAEHIPLSDCIPIDTIPEFLTHLAESELLPRKSMLKQLIDAHGLQNFNDRVLEGMKKSLIAMGMLDLITTHTNPTLSTPDVVITNFKSLDVAISALHGNPTIRISSFNTEKMFKECHDINTIGMNDMVQVLSATDYNGYIKGGPWDALYTLLIENGRTTELTQYIEAIELDNDRSDALFKGLFFLAKHNKSDEAKALLLRSKISDRLNDYFYSSRYLSTFLKATSINEDVFVYALEMLSPTEIDIKDLWNAPSLFDANSNFYKNLPDMPWVVTRTLTYAKKNPVMHEDLSEWVSNKLCLGPKRKRYLAESARVVRKGKSGISEAMYAKHYMRLVMATNAEVDEALNNIRKPESAITIINFRNIKIMDAISKYKFNHAVKQELLAHM